jgi:tryptophanyl-tRNA synthetase
MLEARITPEGEILSSVPSQYQRVLSGMRSTGQLHLGHYHGVLKNWVRLQHEYECFFFVADWHALTTHYEDPSLISDSVWDMVIDWLAAGVNPGSARIFIQSQVPEHAELHLLLSMITPLSWLERVPTYKDQQEALKEKDLATYGFLGYPLLQSADILIYKAGQVPVGEDQVAHVELTREIARRFNHLYGREKDFEEKAEEAAKKMGKKNAKLYHKLRRDYQEQGDHEALKTAQALLETQANITLGDRERLFGYLEGGGRIILPEPQPLLTEASKMPGLDGQKMSKSYHNTITLREDPKAVEDKLRKMPTDPARVRRSDPGDPGKCPVWQLHAVYSDDTTRNWVNEGCRSAGIGCLDCKQPVIDAVLAELVPIRERAQEYLADPKYHRRGHRGRPRRGPGHPGRGTRGHGPCLFVDRYYWESNASEGQDRWENTRS